MGVNCFNLCILIYSQVMIYSSIQFSGSVMCNSLHPHGLWNTRPPWPSPTTGVYSNSCPLSRWFHPTISSSVSPYSSCLQSFPISGSFQMNQFFASVQLSSVQSLSRVQLFATPWIVARQASLSITNSQSSLKLTSIKSVIPSSHLIVCRPLFLLPPVPPSIRVFSSEPTFRMRGPNYWSFSFSIILSKEHPWLISFRMDWLDLLAVQGTLKSLLQHHTSKASFLRHSAFFTVQLSHPHMTTGKTIALASPLLAK